MTHAQLDRQRFVYTPAVSALFVGAAVHADKSLYIPSPPPHSDSSSFTNFPNAAVKPVAFSHSITLQEGHYARTANNSVKAAKLPLAQSTLAFQTLAKQNLNRQTTAMDIRSMLNSEGGAARAAAPPNPPTRSVSMVAEHISSPPPPQNIPTRSMSLSTVTEELPVPLQPPPPVRSVSTVTEASSLKRSSPSTDGLQEPPPKRTRISEERSPVQPARPLKQRPTQVPIYAQKMETRGFRFSNVKADLSSGPPPPPAPTPQANGRDKTPHTPQSNRASSPIPLPDMMEPNVSGIPAYESVRRTICDMLFDNVVKKPDFEASGDVKAHYEIEAKLGRFVDRGTNERLAMPVITDTVLLPHGLNIVFDSSLSKTQYGRLNKYLNDMTARSQAPGRSKIQYTHPKQIDQFYTLTHAGHLALPAEARAQANPNHRQKLRVTTDRKTGQVQARIVKLRLGDLDLYCPSNEFDIRISVNLEVSYPENCDDFISSADSPRSQEASKPRDKDRLSYRHQATQIDLTLVKSPTEKDKYEIEVELDAAQLRQEGRKVMDVEENRYEQLVGQLLENALVLSRAAVNENIKPYAPQIQ
ncbi:MAG: hypothetical protein INR71_03445 [Terriglobus roseus]|nr:hypothetical protein [Terriglobus roseus]